jgi:LemA protein
MNDSVIIIVATAVVLLLMAAAFVYIWFRSIRHELENEWRVVLDDLRLRLDKIPNLIETVRRFAPEEKKAVAELIKLRCDSWPMEEADKFKVQKELLISARLKELWAIEKKQPELARDTNYLSLKTEFKESAAEIESAILNYNDRVRRYNRRVRFIFFLPLSLIFGFRKMPVFEFEP